MSNGGPSAAYLYLYLLAGPQSNYIGLYGLDVGRTTFETQLSEGQLLAGLDQLQLLGIVKFDPATSVIWVLEAAERNIGELKGAADGKKGDLKVVLVNNEF